MGKGKVYRWEKRRQRAERKVSRGKLFVSWHQYILLIFIFALWLIGSKLLYMISITTNACADMAASFGSYPYTPTIATMLLIIAGLILVYALTVAIINRKSLSRLMPALFHLTLIASILTFGLTAYHMRVENLDRPDGSLRANDHIWTHDAGKLVAVPRQNYYSNLAWHKTSPRHDFGEMHSHCVWLDTNEIGPANGHYIEGYLKLAPSERLVAQRYRIAVDWPPKTSIHEKLSIVFGRVSMSENLKRMEMRRPLTLEERERFIIKQDCLRANYRNPNATELCKWHWGMNEWPDE